MSTIGKVSQLLYLKDVKMVGNHFYLFIYAYQLYIFIYIVKNYRIIRDGFNTK